MLKGYKGVNPKGEIAGTGFKQNLTCMILVTYEYND